MRNHHVRVRLRCHRIRIRRTALKHAWPRPDIRPASKSILLVMNTAGGTGVDVVLGVINMPASTGNKAEMTVLRFNSNHEIK